MRSSVDGDGDKRGVSAGVTRWLFSTSLLLTLLEAPSELPRLGPPAPPKPRPPPLLKSNSARSQPEATPPRPRTKKRAFTGNFRVVVKRVNKPVRPPAPRPPSTAPPTTARDRMAIPATSNISSLPRCQTPVAVVAEFARIQFALR